jgi:hypothetical protein
MGSDEADEDDPIPTDEQTDHTKDVLIGVGIAQGLIITIVVICMCII